MLAVGLGFGEFLDGLELLKKGLWGSVRN